MEDLYNKEKHQKAVQKAEIMRKRAVSDLMKTEHGRYLVKLFLAGVSTSTLGVWLVEYHEENLHLRGQM